MPLYVDRHTLAPMRATLLLAIAAVLASVPAARSQAPTFSVTSATVSPRQAYVAGAPVRIAFAIAATAPLDLRVEIVREATRKPVRRLALPRPARPGATQRLRWDGVAGDGEVAANGTYRVRLTAPDGTARNAGTFALRSHIYPIRGPHADRGPIGAFGVGRNGGRTHEGFDVNAACGTKLVAARGGRVVRSDYDPVLYGNIVVVRGERTQRDYWYAHLERPSPLRAGDRVRTGGLVGRIGATGNARTVGCHLHFEIRRRGVPIDPAPELHAWDGWS